MGRTQLIFGRNFSSHACEITFGHPALVRNTTCRRITAIANSSFQCVLHAMHLLTIQSLPSRRLSEGHAGLPHSLSSICPRTWPTPEQQSNPASARMKTFAPEQHHMLWQCSTLMLCTSRHLYGTTMLFPTCEGSQRDIWDAFAYDSRPVIRLKRYTVSAHHGHI